MAVIQEEHQYGVLVERVQKLIAYLDASQEESHVPADADLYWYIQKLQEMELLIESVLVRHRFDLKNSLDNLCTNLQFRLERDEQSLMRRRSA